MSKLLFIYPGLHPSWPIQLGSLSAYVKRAGHETRLFAPVLKDWRVPGDVYANLTKEIWAFSPDFIAFCGYESALSWISQFCKFIKDRKHYWPDHLRLILGGYYPSARPENALQIPGIDIICQGEGEQPLVDLLNNPDRTNIPGMWFDINQTLRYITFTDGIIRNPPASIAPDLDALPWPDRFDDHQSIIDRDGGVVKVMAGWGCVHSCTYCQAKEMRNLIPGLKGQDFLRLRSPRNVVNEVLYLREHYRFSKVGFHDDIFWGGKFNKSWLKEFVKLWKAEVGLPFYAAARVEQFDAETFDLLQQAGCYLLLIGVESGDPAFRRQLLKRHMSDDMIRFVVQESRKRGIEVWTFNMVGMLGETWASMLATVALNWSLAPDFAMCSVWYPLQGTQMGDEAHKRGMVDADAARKVVSYASKSVLKYSWMKKRGLAIVRWLNILSACRRKLFWRLVWERVSH